MIGSVRGRVTHRSGEQVTIATKAGVGYEVHTIPEALNRLQRGEETVFYTHLHVREDDMTLFGFPERTRRDFFRNLLPQKGIGPKMALRIVGDMGMDRFQEAIRQQDVDTLKQVKGIGNKTAKRLILEMDEVLPERSEPGQSESKADARRQEALDALTGLGFTREEADSAIQDVEQDETDLPVEELIQQSLTRLEPTT